MSRSADKDRRLAWLAACFVPAVFGPFWAVLLGNVTDSVTVASVSGFVLICLLVTTSYTDARWRRIPNWATYSAFAWAILLNAIVSLSAPPESFSRIVSAASAEPHIWHADFLGAIGLGNSLMGAGVCLGIMLVVYLFGGQGAGDAKLAATLGALLGPEKGFWILMSTHLIAGVLVLLWSLSRIVRPRLCSLCHLQLREFSLVFHDIPTVFGSKDFLKRRVPLAPFFALGTAATLLGVLMP